PPVAAISAGRGSSRSRAATARGPIRPDTSATVKPARSRASPMSSSAAEGSRKGGDMALTVLTSAPGVWHTDPRVRSTVGAHDYPDYPACFPGSGARGARLGPLGLWGTSFPHGDPHLRVLGIPHHRGRRRSHPRGH